MQLNPRILKSDLQGLVPGALILVTLGPPRPATWMDIYNRVDGVQVTNAASPEDALLGLYNSRCRPVDLLRVLQDNAYAQGAVGFEMDSAWGRICADWIYTHTGAPVLRVDDGSVAYGSSPYVQ